MNHRSHRSRSEGSAKSPPDYDPSHKLSKRALTNAERWFKGYNSAYPIKVDDHYETAIERRLPFTGG